MNILLVRKIKTPNATFGELIIDGIWFCYTVEDTVRAKPGKWTPGVKVYAKTAIPYGIYPVLVTWSNRFKRMLTGVFAVPNFEGIRIHPGKTENSSAGCVLVGYKKLPASNYLISDWKASNDLQKMVEAAQLKGKVKLTIVDGI